MKSYGLLVGNVKRDIEIEFSYSIVSTLCSLGKSVGK